MRVSPTTEQLAWEPTVAHAVTSDIIWKLDVYRAALFLLHVSVRDCGEIRAAHPRDAVADQLTRAAGSISANLAEGYGRTTRADRVRFFNYALGSTRECMSWYQAVSDVIPPDLVEARLELLARIRALLLGFIRSPRERQLAQRFER